MSNKENTWLKVRNINKIEGRTKNFWVKIKNKKTHYDVLIGKKGKEAHIHYGINPNLTITFLEDRKGVQNIKHELIKPDGEAISMEDKTFSGMTKELTLSYKGICRGNGEKIYLGLTELRLIESPESDKKI
ncbi:hypothetical protein HY448_00815 [Candidatus Pacearchaeota archaeon]|nr:hypothetical protein [Candidatus Pacearchaeota archaeon]